MARVSRRRLGSVVLLLSLLGFAAPAAAQDARAARREEAKEEKKKEAPWYERIQIRGYTQLRYNGLFSTNPQLKNDQGDRSIGDPEGFFIRRARLIVYGEMAPFLGIYLQPDFGSAIQESLNVGQLRDWYADIFLDKEKQFRFRVGQQKVPYGWELMQSSQNRLPFDRTDAMNSAFVNERDLGAFFYYETPAIRRRFRRLVDSGLKGSGDYGMTAVGVTNGQPLNTRERNDNKHFFARVTVPFDIGSQTVEVAAGGYTGLFVPTKGEGITGANEYRDLRFHGTFVLYPKPFGVQIEYSAGIGPELQAKQIVERPLDGGYAMVMFRQHTEWGAITPYVRVHRYDGGKKFETNSPRHEIKELNAGIEWQIQKWLELTTEFMASDRTVDGKRQEGKLFRLQLQFNY